jgi:8-oxo-dGTP pyrophosphatase MutT (NUDIX family)
MSDFPKIKSRRTIDVSPWMNIIEREVAFTEDGKTELYHAVGQQDYIAIVAMTPEGLIPVVRQYRPAVESLTWELPAGMTEPGEDPADTCRRELLEETALPARAVRDLGTFAPCTARLSNRVHSFFVETGPRQTDRSGEAGIEMRLVSPAELADLIRAGTFTLQLHIGALMLAGMRGFLDFRAFNAPKRRGAIP